MKPINKTLQNELNESYAGLLVLDVFSPRGTVIIIDIGNEYILFRTTIYLAYWEFAQSAKQLLTGFEPPDNRDTYREILGCLRGKRLEKIWFNDQKLTLSFSDEFQFKIIEDDEKHGTQVDVVRFSDQNKTGTLCYRTASEWVISADEEIVNEDTLCMEGSSLVDAFMSRQKGATVTKVFQTIGSCLIFEMVSPTGRPSSFLVTLCYWGLEYNEILMLIQTSLPKINIFT